LSKGKRGGKEWKIKRGAPRYKKRSRADCAKKFRMARTSGVWGEKLRLVAALKNSNRSDIETEGEERAPVLKREPSRSGEL